MASHEEIPLSLLHVMSDNSGGISVISKVDDWENYFPFFVIYVDITFSDSFLNSRKTRNFRVEMNSENEQTNRFKSKFGDLNTL